MQTSYLSVAHRATYLVERSLALPVALGVILSADFAHMPYGMTNFLLTRVTVLHVIFAFAFIAAWTLCFPSRHAQQNSGLAITRRIANNFLGVLVITGIFGLLLLKTQATPIGKVLPLFLIAITILTTLRLFLIAALDSGMWRDKLNVLILGTGPIARRAWRDIRTKHYRTANVVGFVDDECMETALPEIRERHISTVANLETSLLKTAVDLIVIALPTKSCYDSIQAAIGVAEDVGVDVVQFESVFSLSRLGKQTSSSHNAVYSVHHVGQVAAQLFKRMLDVVLSGAGIILLSPLLILIAITIKITDPGPALFVQERYGYRRRKFKLFKFRTMVMNAEHMMADLEKLNEADGPIFKIKHDPRITKVGRILRKTSLDELPQLFNVLIGDMSLVGPRPMSLRDVSLFSRSNLMRRFAVKPGITGLWQVSGRSNTTFDHWISMDFRYIDDWSFWLDLSILARTIPVVIKGSGAM